MVKGQFVMIVTFLAFLLFLWLLFGMKLVSFSSCLLSCLNRRTDVNRKQKWEINSIFFLGFIGWCMIFIRITEALMNY